MKYHYIEIILIIFLLKTSILFWKVHTKNPAYGRTLNLSMYADSSTDFVKISAIFLNFCVTKTKCVTCHPSPNWVKMQKKYFKKFDCLRVFNINGSQSYVRSHWQQTLPIGTLDTEHWAKSTCLLSNTLQPI